MPVDPNEVLDRIVHIITDQVAENPDDYGIAPILEMHRDGELLGMFHFMGTNNSDEFMPIVATLIPLLSLDTVCLAHDAYMLKPTQPGDELPNLKRGSLQEAFKLGDPDVSECLCVSVATRDGSWDDARRPYTVVGKEVVWGADVQLKGATVGGYIVDEIRRGFSTITLLEHVQSEMGSLTDHAATRLVITEFVEKIVTQIVEAGNPMMLLKTKDQLDEHPLAPLLPC